MYYSEAYFGKDIAALTYADIEDYFKTEQTESDKIEFKSYKAGGNVLGKEDSIIECICGMLNSEGGLIIWGTPEGIKESGKKEKKFIGDLCPVEHLYEKDAFISKITDKITPSPRGIKFHRIENEGKYLYVFDTEKSMYAPHQFRGIYHMRIDAQTRPAPHHYVEALFNQISYPKLEGYISLHSYVNQPAKSSPFQMNEEKYFYIALSIFNFSRFQHEEDLYYRIILEGATFSGSRNVRNKTSGNNDLSVHNATGTLFYYEPFTHESIKINVNSDEFIGVTILFAGKKSPLMTSYYQIKIPKDSVFQNCDDLISYKYENVPFYEVMDRRNLTKETWLKQILSR